MEHLADILNVFALTAMIATCLKWAQWQIIRELLALQAHLIQHNAPQELLPCEWFIDPKSMTDLGWWHWWLRVGQKEMEQIANIYGYDY